MIMKKPTKERQRWRENEKEGREKINNKDGEATQGKIIQRRTEFEVKIKKLTKKRQTLGVNEKGEGEETLSNKDAKTRKRNVMKVGGGGYKD